MGIEQNVKHHQELPALHSMENSEAGEMVQWANVLAAN